MRISNLNSGGWRDYILPSIQKGVFAKHIKPLHQPHEETLVLRTYLSSTIRDEVDSLGDDAGEILKKLE